MSRPGKTPSIRRRLLALLLIPTAAISALATYSAYRTALTPFEAASDQDLLDAALAIASSPTLSLTPDAVRMLRWDSLDTIYYRVSGGDGRFVAGDAGLPVSHQRVRNPSFADAVYHGEPIRTANYRVSTAGGAAIITVAETLHKREIARRDVLKSSLAVDAAQLATALIVIWLGVRFAIEPLHAMERQLALRRAGDLDPLLTTGVPIEIRSLIDALNRLLQALRDAGQTERDFLENAAHQLRTPLAGMLAQLELLVAETSAGRDTPLREVLEAGRRLARTTGQLLALARSDSAARASADFEAVSLPALIEAVVMTRLAAADRAGVELDAQIEPVEVRGVRWLLEEALGNLVDNAIAATPEGGSVTLRCGRTEGRAFIEVSDTGIGIPPDERQQVFERFYRASNARSKGSGLGLAIVSEVARIHRAELALEAGSQGRGTRVRIMYPQGKLPASPTPRFATRY